MGEQRSVATTEPTRAAKTGPKGVQTRSAAATDSAPRQSGSGSGSGSKSRSAKTSPRKGSSRLEDARARMYQDLIFESAECVFGEKGFEGATMQEIAAEAGVSLKTVYASYPGKRDLYAAIMLAHGQAMFEAVQSAQSSAGSPVEQLVRGTRAFVDYLFAHEDWSRIHVRSQISWALRPRGEEVGELWDRGHRADVELFREGIEAGVFWEDDPEEMALMLRAMTRVQVVQAIDRGETDAEAVANRLIARLLRMVCKDEIDLREAG